MSGTEVLKGNLHEYVMLQRKKTRQSSFHKSYGLLKYFSCNKVIKETKVKTVTFLEVQMLAMPL